VNRSCALRPSVHEALHEHADERFQSTLAGTSALSCRAKVSGEFTSIVSVLRASERVHPNERRAVFVAFQ
jgi:hypothetical protein